MARNRASAKAAGSRFERQVADHLATEYDDRIDRRVKTGAADKGDIAGLRTRDGRRVVVECKDWGGQIKAAEVMAEVDTETENDEALAGVAVIKRKGVTDPSKQWVLTTVEHLLWLLKGER